MEKSCREINLLLGLWQGITANCTLNGNLLYANYTDSDWSGKLLDWQLEELFIGFLLLQQL